MQYCNHTYRFMCAGTVVRLVDKLISAYVKVLTYPLAYFMLEDKGVGRGLSCLVVMCAVRCNVGGEVKWIGTDGCLITLHLAAYVGGTKQPYHTICKHASYQ